VMREWAKRDAAMLEKSGFKASLRGCIRYYDPVQILTSATSLPATPPYRPLFGCGHRARLPPQQRHLEDTGFTTLHIDSLCIWFFFYIVDQRPIRQNVYIPRGFFRGVPSCSEDLCRVPRAFIVLFPQSLCSFLNLIFQSSLTRFRDLEREKFASTGLAEIGVRELLLKPPSRLSEFCIQGFLDSLILIVILRSKSKMTLGGCEIGSYCSITRHFRFL
jgi:hypothetical protein